MKDLRDLPISGATSVARDAFERALEAHLSWRRGFEIFLAQRDLLNLTFLEARRRIGCSEESAA